VAAEVLACIKEGLLGRLSDCGDEEPGFRLLTVILGRNPFTEEPVPRTAEDHIRGFITLLPGGEAVYQQLAETGVIGEAAGRIEGALESLGITWDFVVGLFTGIWERLSIESLTEPIGTFAMIVEQFGEPVTRLFAFVNVVLRELFAVLLAAMDFPTDIVGSIISNVISAIEDIRQDPIGFLTNMLQAIRVGFQNFFGNILSHLAGGLADWLFRGLRDAGLEPPADLSLESVLGFVMEVLGISTERLWEMLGERIGEENVERIRGAIDRLTGIWEFVADVRERGITAIWEHIASQITGLWDMVLEKAREWIMERVITRAAQWLMSLLDPTGITAVVNSVRSFIAAVQSAVEYARDILAIVADYTSTIVAVARGEVGPGAEKLEQGLANAVPVAIGFLMNQLGLGDVGEKIREIVAGLRQTVDRALTWLVDRAVGAVQSVLRTLGMGREEQEEGDDSAEREESGSPVRTVFTMGAESHTLTARLENGQVLLTMASQREVIITVGLRNAIEELRSMDKFQGRKRIIDRLERALSLADPEEIRQYWYNPENQADLKKLPTNINKPGKFVELRLSEIVAEIQDLAVGNIQITSLTEMFNQLNRQNGPYSHLTDPADVAPFKEFTKTQRRTVLAENEENGVITSDDPNDPYQVLDDSKPAGSPDKPEIDHIFPRSLGGSNSYSNARVVSGALNRGKSSTVTVSPAFGTPSDRSDEEIRAVPPIIRRREDY
jgi:hypothetical protein